MDKDKLNEKELVEFTKLDPKYFQELYEFYYPKVYRYIKYKITGEEQTAEDLTSITFEKALKNISGFKWQGVSFSAWIFRIANNTLIDYYRVNSRNKEKTLDQFEIKDLTNLEENVEKYDTAQRMKKFINELNPREKRIVILKFYEGYTNKEIAGILDISETNTGTILNRSMKKLRELWIKSEEINV